MSKKIFTEKEIKILSKNKNILKVNCTLCQGHIKKSGTIFKHSKGDSCILQESFFLNSIGIYGYCNNSRIFSFLF